ncbi:hypothetical protein SLEP1_g22243 [Rubroshorea leprosula]|uniref:Uncharacterized protein n=1 Tax=Rubroshorea leprosula TaxID=152421 RepID=A0AAV5JKL0_9ROSI|nr:hypothetical protein SLEP1_g22243 [Rubroshorea leprosula]
MLEKLWDDVVAGPQPDHGLDLFRKISTTVRAGEEGSRYQRSLSMPTSPGTPVTPVMPTTPQSARKDNVWRSVFHPGSNLATKTIGAEVFDKPAQPNSPTVYDCNQTEAQRRKENVALCLVGVWK